MFTAQVGARTHAKLPCSPSFIDKIIDFSSSVDNKSLLF